MTVLLCWLAFLAGFLVGAWWASRGVNTLLQANHALGVNLVLAQNAVKVLAEEIEQTARFRTAEQVAIDQLIRETGGQP